MKKTLLAVSFAICCLMLANPASNLSAQENQTPAADNTPAVTQTQQTPQPEMAQNQAAAPKKWTFMVFSNGDNNLDSDLVRDAQEMEKAGLSDDVNIIVQLDRENKPARRYSLTDRKAGAKADDWGLTGNKVMELGEVDMGDYKQLVEFVKWSKENYPASKYMLVIENHGSGWKKKAQKAFRGISYDDQSGNHITTKDLGVAMEKIQQILGKPLDVFGMDACLMQMMEVAYEVKDNVKFISASEEVEPGAGWPYDFVCPPLVQNPKLNGKEFVNIVVSAFGESYKNETGATQSAVDCSKLDDLANALDAFAASVIESAGNAADVKAFKWAVSKSQKFDEADNVDIGNLMKNIQESAVNAKIKDAAVKVLMAYEKAVMQNSQTGGSVSNATGMAIYIPTYGFNAKYATTKFAALRWDEMIKSVYSKKDETNESAAPAVSPMTNSNPFMHGMDMPPMMKTN